MYGFVIIFLPKPSIISCLKLKTLANIEWMAVSVGWQALQPLFKGEEEALKINANLFDTVENFLLAIPVIHEF